jgi:hypothetical protein
VWQLRWIEKERGSGEEKAEVLVSVSIDGRVTQWSIRKGFENYGACDGKQIQLWPHVILSRFDEIEENLQQTQPIFESQEI